MTSLDRIERLGARALLAGLWAALLLLIAALVVAPAAAQDSRRVALVVGAAAYTHVPALKNTKADAQGVAAALKRLGFDVQTEFDPSRAQLEAALRRFGAQARGAEAGLFFYAGHAIESQGRNWLVPVDATLEGARDLRFEAIDIEAVMEQAQTARVALLFLDACRNNPFADRLAAGTRSAPTRGLARIDPTTGVFVAFATAPGQVAYDGAGDNSPFTSALLKYMEEPGLEIRQMMTRVRADVRRATKDQAPWEQSALEGEFFFKSAPKAAAPPSATAPVGLDKDGLFWDTIRGSQRREDYEAYLNMFPQGAFVPLAARELERLKAAAEKAASDKAASDKAASDKAAADKAAGDKAAAAKAEAEKAAAHKGEAEKAAAAKAAADKAAAETAAAAKALDEKPGANKAAEDKAAAQKAAALRAEPPPRAAPSLPAPSLPAAQTPAPAPPVASSPRAEPARPAELPKPAEPQKPAAVASLPRPDAATPGPPPLDDATVRKLLPEFSLEFARQALSTFRAEATPRAMAVARGKGYWRVWNQQTREDARDMALEACEFQYRAACRLVMLDDEAGDAPARAMPRLARTGPISAADVPFVRASTRKGRDLLNYPAERGPKAIAIAPSGALRIAFAATQREAETKALADCAAGKPHGGCFLYAVGDQIVLAKRATEPLSAAGETPQVAPSVAPAAKPAQKAPSRARPPRQSRVAPQAEDDEPVRRAAPRARATRAAPRAERPPRAAPAPRSRCFTVGGSQYCS